MKGFTIQNSIDLLEKAVESGSGGTTAASVTYDNTTSHLTADDVQEAIDEIVASMPTVPTAASVTYDNTTSHLTADDVQEAIDELNTKILPVGTYSTDETVVGKWLDDRDIYRKVFPVETAITLASGLWTDLTGVDNTGMDMVLGVTIFQYDTSEFVCSMPVGGYKGTTVVRALSFRSQTTIAIGSYIAVDYLKSAPTNTRKKK